MNRTTIGRMIGNKSHESISKTIQAVLFPESNLPHRDIVTNNAHNHNARDITARTTRVLSKPVVR